MTSLKTRELEILSSSFGGSTGIASLFEFDVVFTDFAAFAGRLAVVAVDVFAVDV